MVSMRFKGLLMLARNIRTLKLNLRPHNNKLAGNATAGTDLLGPK